MENLINSAVFAALLGGAITIFLQFFKWQEKRSKYSAFKKVYLPLLYFETGQYVFHLRKYHDVVVPHPVSVQREFVWVLRNMEFVNAFERMDLLEFFSSEDNWFLNLMKMRNSTHKSEGSLLYTLFSLSETIRRVWKDHEEFSSTSRDIEYRIREIHNKLDVHCRSMDRHEGKHPSFSKWYEQFDNIRKNPVIGTSKTPFQTSECYYLPIYQLGHYDGLSEWAKTSWELANSAYVLCVQWTNLSISYASTINSHIFLLLKDMNEIKEFLELNGIHNEFEFTPEDYHLGLHRNAHT